MHLIVLIYATFTFGHFFLTVHKVEIRETVKIS
jgi:hypothetical protein